MKRKQMISRQKMRSRREAGFTLLELAIATVILMVGIVSVVQLVPASLQSNLNNRVDTTAMVFAQREMDQMAQQALSASTFVDSDGRAINLGSTTTSNTVFGGPVVMVGTQASIGFTAGAVSGYQYTFTDPNDPEGANYEMRWAVISIVSNGNVVSKRFIVGCRRSEVSQSLNPAVVDTLVEK